MLDKALKLLKNQYDENKPKVENNEFLIRYLNEKWRHSMQVFGAGNMLVRHIDWLREKPADYIEMVRTAVLLHDVFRFKEISLLAENKKIDHGVEGAKFLKNIPLFSDIRIWLPIYHHGHLIEDLYADEQYQNLPEDLRREVKLICFIIRDADKIANLHMLANETSVHPLFLGTGTGNAIHDGSITDSVKKVVFSGRTVDPTYQLTTAERMLRFLSWFNDINYCYSIDFCSKLRVIQNLKGYFAQICNDEAFVKEYFAYFDECLRLRDFLA